MRIEEAFAAEGIKVRDEAFIVSCGSCNLAQSLSDASLRDAGDGRSEYVCARQGCGSVLVMVGPSSVMAGGYKVGGNLVMPMGDFELQTEADDASR